MQERSRIKFSMNKLPISKRAEILHMFIEGNSLRSTSQMANVSINTVTKLLVDVGSSCVDYQDKKLRNLSCKRIQVDEIWSFCYSKQKNIPEEKKEQFGYGDIWTWTAICADTKLIPSWLVGSRDAEYANIFISDLASRMYSKMQLTSDGLKSYLEAVENTFGADIDYAMLVKVYGAQKRYNPPECIAVAKKAITGTPDEQRINTSFVERQNVTMRMGMRRFTRFTNGFSKKVENHEYAIALHFMHHNFGRIHKTLRVTPAMEASIENHVWSLEEIAKLSDKNSN